VKLVVADESLPVVQESEPYALAAPWPTDDQTVDEQIVNWADAVVIGPGLGRSAASRQLLERVLARWPGATVLDADAVTLFEGRSSDLGELLGGRPVLLTPHPAELARLAARTVDEVLQNRFDIGRELAAALRAV